MLGRFQEFQEAWEADAGRRVARTNTDRHGRTRMERNRPREGGRAWEVGGTYSGAPTPAGTYSGRERGKDEFARRLAPTPGWREAPTPPPRARGHDQKGYSSSPVILRCSLRNKGLG